MSIAKAEEPKVLNWVYECQPSGSFGAQFLVGSQQATLWLPGKPAIALKQLMSGSGARYGGQSYELFIKGQDAFLEKNGEKIASDCKALAPRSLAADGSEILTEADGGKALQLKVEQTAHFKMPVQTGTGFSWEAFLEGPDLQLQFGPQTAAAQPGAPAEQAIGAKAVRTGYLVLEFKYARPWEKGSPPAKIVRFPILITE
jgi:membrane-bound inhibitor of C-type lysozyme/predicted secreted protein